MDAAVEKVVTAVLNAGGCAFLTADHGNAEKMKNPDGTPLLSHDIQQRAAAYLEEYGA